MELYIARHGETEANVARIWQGQGLDTPLTQEGVNQAKILKKSLEGIEFDVIYSSPLKRAMDTARIVFGESAQLITDDRLMEIRLGEAEGSSYDGGGPLMVDPTAYIPPPGGETLPEMIARIGSFLRELAEKPYSRVFALTHGYALKVVYACSKDSSVQALADTPRYGNCALERYIHNGTKWSLA